MDIEKQPAKEKKGFFDINIFGLKLTPVWAIGTGLVLSSLEYFIGGTLFQLLGPFGSLLILVGIIGLVKGLFFKKKK